MGFLDKLNPIAMIGGSLLGGVLGSKSSEKAAKSAAASAERTAQLQADTQRYFFDQLMKQQYPYQQAGLMGLQQLTGMGPGQLMMPQAQPQPVQQPAQPMQPATPSYSAAQKRYLGMSGPDGSEHLDMLRGFPTQQPMAQPGGVPQPVQSALGGFKGGLPGLVSSAAGGPTMTHGTIQGGEYKFPATTSPPGGVDPTGGAGKYMGQMESMGPLNLPKLSLPEFNYKFDANDPGYQFRQQEMQKSIDQAAAARGNYNSRAAMATHAQGSQSLTADEIDRQFGRQKDIYDRSMQSSLSKYGADYGRTTDLYNQQYGKLTDLFNMAGKLGTQDYNKILDMIKIGQGAAGQAGQGAMSTGQGLSSVYGQLGQAQQGAAYATGQAGSDFWGGLGAMPMQYMLMQQLMK